jgi:hypothetical protein
MSTSVNKFISNNALVSITTFNNIYYKLKLWLSSFCFTMRKGDYNRPKGKDAKKPKYKDTFSKPSQVLSHPGA